jgi:hypothetical protein
LFRALSTKVNILICSVNQAGHCSRQDDASSPVPGPTLHPKRTTPLKRNMIAWRRRFRCWALKSPARLCLRSPAKVHRAGKNKAARVRHRTASRATAGSPLAFRREDSRGGPTRDVVRTTHVGPNQPLAHRHGRIESMRTSWQKPARWTRRRDLARELPAEVKVARGPFARHIDALVHAMNPSYGRDRSPR